MSKDQKSIRKNNYLKHFLKRIDHQIRDRKLHREMRKLKQAAYMKLLK